MYVPFYGDSNIGRTNAREGATSNKYVLNLSPLARPIDPADRSPSERPTEDIAVSHASTPPCAIH